ncbi:MAG: T9SS type A sorting domain-containing protein [Melioribacteraceae bacterium]|nr:T9SS type A sorting domain-containing protein [Melioribacteraceae bacterium]
MANNKTFSTIIIFFLLGSLVFLIGRSFRVSKVPHGSKFSCNTCHTNGGGSSLNAFGLDVGTKVTPNGSESFWTAEFAALDSDGDGFTNGEELQDPNGEWREGSNNPGDAALVTNPGNGNSVPTSIKGVENIFTFSLENNYPNPFNPSTVIRYEIGERSVVTLKVYNSLGEEITTLVNKEQIAGVYEVQFFANGGLASGIYFYRLQAGTSAGSVTHFSKTKKMTLLL